MEPCWTSIQHTWTKKTKGKMKILQKNEKKRQQLLYTFTGHTLSFSRAFHWMAANRKKIILFEVFNVLDILNACRIMSRWFRHSFESELCIPALIEFWYMIVVMVSGCTLSFSPPFSLTLTQSVFFSVHINSKFRSNFQLEFDFVLFGFISSRSMEFRFD